MMPPRASATALLAASLLLGAAAPPSRPARAAAPVPVAVQGGAPGGVPSVPGFDGGVHVPSGFRFPDRIDGYARAGGERFAADNLSARYERPGADGAAPWLTLYVYPAVVPLSVEEEGVRAAIVRRWPTRPVADPPTAPAGVLASGWFEADVAGAPSITAYALGRNTGWTIKLRLTGANDAATRAAFERAVAAVDWSAPLRPRRHKPTGIS